MLKIVGIERIVKETIETDDYVPIKVIWDQHDESAARSIYWRIGDMKKSLLEIELSSKSGALRSITPICTNNIFMNSNKINIPGSFEIGMPIFDIQNWPEYGKQELGIFEIHYCENQVALVMSRNPVTRKMISDRVYFGIDDDSQLCIITIDKLSLEESMKIKNTLQFNMQNL